MADKNVKFTPDQQARVQELIDGAYKKAYARAAGQNSINSDCEELRGLREEVEKLKAYKKNAAIIKAISKFNVVDPSEVTELIAPHVSVDNDGTVLAGACDLTLEEYTEKWIGERPHHLKKDGE